MRRTVFAMYGGLMAGTRVDTGRARLNWNVTMDSPNRRTRPEPHQAPNQGGSPTSTEERTSGFQQAIMQIKAGNLGSVYLANSLPYIMHLNKLDNFVAPLITEIKGKLERGVYSD